MAGKIAGKQEVLQEAGDQDAPRSRVAGVRKERGERQRCHHRDVEKDRGGRGTGKTLHDVQDAAIEGDQRDQQEIGKGDARQFDRLPPLFGVVGEARRKNAHGLRREQPGKGKEHELRDKQQREDAVGEQLGGGFAALAVDMGIGRNKCGVEGPFGKDGAKMIRQAQRHEERIRHRTCAEDRREHDVAGKSGQPRKERVAADGEDTTEHAPLLKHAALTLKQRTEILPVPVCRGTPAHSAPEAEMT